MTVTVVMPTVGRPSLERAIASVVDQLEDSDELLVIGDGERPVAADVVAGFQPAPVTYVECLRPGSVFGNAQRDFGMQLAYGRSSHLMFLDDDDVYVHGGFDVVRRELEFNPNSAHIFRARWGPRHHAFGVELWQDQVVREQNIATPMVVLPNRYYDCSWWQFNARGVVSDFGFLAAALGQCSVAWHTDVIAVVRP